jgi:NAD(P)-dependent dehydrogenase (short-subunit alcohol dehydrogenase family)
VKSVLITGGTGGLGSAVVPRLARDYRCVVLHRNAASLSDLQQQVPAIEGIGSPAEASRYAPLHGVVLLAGGFTAGAKASDFTKMFEANVMTVATTMEAVLPHLGERARIVAISSAASISHPPGLAAYTASKAAVNAIIRTMANELASRHITANALLPTALDTPAMRSGGMPADQLVPLDRVAEWIAFLLSDKGAAVNGQLIELRA